MLHFYKINGHRVALDTVGKKAFTVSALAMKMLDSVTPPMSPDCPSSLRYSMAKYDSQDLAAAYAELYDLYSKGLLFGPETNEVPSEERFTEISIRRKDDITAVKGAITAGNTRLHILIQGMSAGDAADIAGQFSMYPEIRFFYKAPDGGTDSNEWVLLNTAGCYVYAVGEFLSGVLGLADKGVRFISAELPTDSKAVAKLAKEMEKRAKDGNSFRFAAFDTAADIPAGAVPDSHCAECWARSICGGRYTAAPELCDSERVVIECAFVPKDAE